MFVLECYKQKNCFKYSYARSRCTLAEHPEEIVKSNYERDTIIPDPSICYVKAGEDKSTGTEYKEVQRCNNAHSFQV